jgi:hypothetical protein
MPTKHVPGTLSEADSPSAWKGHIACDACMGRGGSCGLRGLVVQPQGFCSTAGVTHQSNVCLRFSDTAVPASPYSNGCNMAGSCVFMIEEPFDSRMRDIADPSSPACAAGLDADRGGLGQGLP